MPTLRRSHGDVVEAIYLEVKSCVDEVKAAAAFWPCVPDGWTAPNGDYMLNAVELIEGIPFYSFQANPQGEKCDAVWMLKVLKVYIYQNVRAVKEFWAARRVAKDPKTIPEPGCMRLGAGWPATGVRLTLENVNADCTLDLAAVLETSTLAAAIHSLEQGDEEQAVARALAQPPASKAKAKPATAKPLLKQTKLKAPPAAGAAAAGKRKRAAMVLDSDEEEGSGTETSASDGKEDDGDDDDD